MYILVICQHLIIGGRDMLHCISMSVLYGSIVHGYHFKGIRKLKNILESTLIPFKILDPSVHCLRIKGIYNWLHYTVKFQDNCVQWRLDPTNSPACNAQRIKLHLCQQSSNPYHFVYINQQTSQFSNNHLYWDCLCISNHILTLSLMKYFLYFHLQSEFTEVAPPYLTTANGATANNRTILKSCMRAFTATQDSY